VGSVRRAAAGQACSTANRQPQAGQASL
jgi:hypothetical protein